MFDKYTVTNSPSHTTSSVRVEEHRSPTDESIRLLNEMEEKALGNIVQRITVDDNNLKGKLLISRDIRNGLDAYELAAIFSINGVKYHRTKKANAVELQSFDTRTEFKKLFREAVFEALCENVEVL